MLHHHLRSALGDYGASVHHSEGCSLYVPYPKELLKVGDETQAGFTFFFLLYKITVITELNNQTSSMAK